MRFWPLIVSAFLVHGALAQSSNNVPKFFTYVWTLDTLSNVLSFVTVPTEHKNLVALYFIVRTGSRNEVEAGKSGFAHFFEHIMFRGSEHFTAAQREAIMKKAGAESNAYTSDDLTVYHALFSVQDLDT